MLRKFVAAVVMLVIIFSLMPVIYAANENIIPEADSIMAEGYSWKPFNGGKISVENVDSANGSEKVLKCSDLGTNTWVSPSLEIYQHIKKDVEKNGEGSYLISFEIMFDGEKYDDYEVACIVRGTNKAGFLQSGQSGSKNKYHGRFGSIKAFVGQWKKVVFSFDVKKADVEGENSWLLCFDGLPAELKTIWLDDFSITRAPTDADIEKLTGVFDSTKFKTKTTNDNKTTATNLVPQADSQMDASNGWKIFGGGEVGTAQTITKDGKKELALKTTGLGKDTWSSPSYDIFSIIKADVNKNGGGRYAISFNFMLEGGADKEYLLNLLVRASNKTALFKNGNGGDAGYRCNIGQITAKTGLWRNFSSTFAINKEDVEGDETWRFCFDTLAADLHTVWIDDFSIIRISDDVTPTVKNVMCVDSSKYSSQASDKTAKEDAAETKSGNLLDEKTSTLEGVSTWQETAWSGFSAGKMEIIADGFSGSALKMSTPENTWGSPALEIFPYIKEAGKYSISAFVKYDGNGEKKFNFILRGTRENSFISKSGTNFFGTVGTVTLTAGQWTRIASTIEIKEEDISKLDSWRLCVSKVDPDVEAIYIDEIVLIKGVMEELPETPTPNEGVVLAEKGVSGAIQLYDPFIAETAKIALIVTVIVVAVVIAAKICLRKFLRKR